MMLKLNTVEDILKSISNLHVIYDESYELSFRSEDGLEIAVERKSIKKAIGLWIQDTLDPSNLGLSPSTTIKFYPAAKPRAHLSAPKLTGPYKNRLGNDCWNIKFTEEADVRILITSYLNKQLQTPTNSSPNVSAQTSQSIKENIQKVEGIFEPDLENEEALFPEGLASYRVHRHLERDGSLPIRAKEKRMRETGSLSCDVCGFDFQAMFGRLGFGYIEAHHTKPVSTLNGTETTNISDLALVCSNCHRMLHRGGDLMQIEALRRLIGRREDGDMQ